MKAAGNGHHLFPARGDSTGRRSVSVFTSSAVKSGPDVPQFPAMRGQRTRSITQCYVVDAADKPANSRSLPNKCSHR